MCALVNLSILGIEITLPLCKAAVLQNLFHFIIFFNRMHGMRGLKPWRWQGQKKGGNMKSL